MINRVKTPRSSKYHLTTIGVYIADLQVAFCASAIDIAYETVPIHDVGQKENRKVSRQTVRVVKLQSS